MTGKFFLLSPIKTSKTSTSIFNKLENTKTLISAIVYLTRMLRFFTATGIISTLLFIVTFLRLTPVFLTSELKTLDYISFFRYGLFVGTIATDFWGKNFKNYAKKNKNLTQNPANARFIRCGGMAEWLKAAVLKTVDGNVRGFESYFLRHFFIGKGEMAESAEGARLLSECTP